ncbi:MAG: glycerate kinase [SAR202 cluster bacterium]|nr:glycerate kinase [SAR202 cluster bacterium]HAE33364.1 glycerate kinase [Dehalococcoidia bacterium]
MKIVIAPQAFKGSLSALNVANAVQKGVRRIFPDAQILTCPVADGGDGTLETLVESSGGKIMETNVADPTGKPIVAQWGAMGDGNTAVIEMARTSGLALLTLEERDPLNATTYGLGEIIVSALNKGFRKFIVGIGGSATNDAGAGMAQALGIRLMDREGRNLVFGGAALQNLSVIDTSSIDQRVLESNFQIACDVNNPLTGPEGASAVYGPQKGATEENVIQLDSALGVFAEVAKRDLGKDISNLEGAGAAGGLGAGMIAFVEGHLRAGVDIVLDTVNLAEKLESADLVITGEGSIDFQTVYNKAPIGVARMAKARGIPTIGISGMLGKNYQIVHNHGIDAALSIANGPISLEESLQNAPSLISEAVEESLRLISVGMKLRN